MDKKYNSTDLIYDLAYVAVFIGLTLFVIGSFPDLLNKLF